MKYTVKIRLIIITLILIAPANVFSCGPEFPDMLTLGNRSQNLMLAPPSFFSKELKKLAGTPLSDMPLAEPILDWQDNNKKYTFCISVKCPNQR